MKAVIPAAKKKEDLFPFSESKPTALMPVKGESLIFHNIKKLKNQGIDEIYVVTNYKEEVFREMFDERNDVNIVSQEDLSGTARSLEVCDFIEEDFIVINGDVVVSENDIKKLVDVHESDVSMLATEESKPEKFGVLSIQNDEVVGLEEKPEDPENTLVNSGIYAFNPVIFELIRDSDKNSITDVISENLEGLDCRFGLIDDYWIDIGSPKKLLKADQVLREFELEAGIDDSAEIHDSAVLDENVEVQADVKIGPNCIIRENTVIAEGSEIEANTVVENSTIGKSSMLENSHVSDSFLFEEQIVDSFADIEQTILGEECDIKSGTVVKESFIGPRSYIDMNNSIRGVKFVPDARTDLSEISK